MGLERLENAPGVVLVLVRVAVTITATERYGAGQRGWSSSILHEDAHTHTPTYAHAHTQPGMASRPLHRDDIINHMTTSSY